MGGSLNVCVLSGAVCLIVCLLPLLCTTDDPYKIVTLSHNATGRALLLPIDGITIQSAEYYTDENLLMDAVVIPMESSQRLLIQFEYLDIQKKENCEDFLKVCELDRTWISHQCGYPIMLKPFCGTLKDLFEENSNMNQQPFMSTVHVGRGVRIRWKTTKGTGKNRGFKMVITSYTATGKCNQKTNWHCGDGRCISNSLHCDGVNHCLDKSDEIKNCSKLSDDLSNGAVPAKCTKDKPCFLKWRDHWFGLILPLAAVFVLVVMGIAFKIRRQLFGPGIPIPSPPRRRRRRRQRDSESRSEPLDPSAPPEAIHCRAPMIAPPPYSPPETFPNRDTAYIIPPQNGEPPPLYEETPSVPLPTVSNQETVKPSTSDDDHLVEPGESFYVTRL